MIYKKLFISIFLLSTTLFIYSQTGESSNKDSQKIVYTSEQLQLRITANDVKIITVENGYHLYIRKNNFIGSVLLTDTTKDPEGKNDSYAYRAKEYNSINGDEIRYLDGKVLESEGSKYSLVDSSVEKTDFFEEAFHIFIPQTIIYGYEWTRNGEINIGKGTFINIRTFQKPYADYSGDYVDNPFMFDFVSIKKPAKDKIALNDDYNPTASEKFNEISENVIYSKGPESIVADISSILKTIPSSSVGNIVLAIDATGSMKNDIEKFKIDLPKLIEEYLKTSPESQIGLLFYRDYGDSFNYEGLPVKFYGFTNKVKVFEKNLKSIWIYGSEGGDIPEAVYEAIYGAVKFFKWNDESEKRIILIGDAEPHPVPRKTKKYSKDYVLSLAKQNGIVVNSILLPKD
ncbi:MAG: VWA domain-containing protein [Treponema sp.]|nr:VWA domain-containing protein [Treponema sp.]